MWHPDVIYSLSGGVPNSALPPRLIDDDSMVLYLPACPLTQTNALYLCRQRKAFLLGYPGPDFANGSRGESNHVGRPGVQEVNEAGGDDGLRAMGLLPWEEDDATDEEQKRVLGMANGILFPDQYGMV
jgi:hypothetical protein